MKYQVLIFALFAYGICFSQNGDPKFINKQIDINELIILKKTDKHQQTILIDFKNSQNKEDKIRVEEFIDYFEIIVDHPSKNDYTGGAECYKLNKQTGKAEMIWHEHPMKIEIIEEEKK